MICREPWTYSSDCTNGGWTREASAGCFASDRFLSFFRDVVPAMFRGGQLRFYWLEIDGKPIAALYELVGDQILYAYQSGVDPEAIEHEPGKLLHAMLVRDAIDRGCQAFDLLRGDEPFKAVFGAKPRPVVAFRVVPCRAGRNSAIGLWLARYCAKKWLKSKLRKAKPLST